MTARSHVFSRIATLGVTLASFALACGSGAEQPPLDGTAPPGSSGTIGTDPGTGDRPSNDPNADAGTDPGDPDDVDGSAPEPAPTEDDAHGWIGAWGAAPFGPYPNGIIGGPVDPLSTSTAFQGNQGKNQTFRMIIHPTTGGDWVRVRLSNAMGTRPVTFDSVHVAVRAKDAAVVKESLAAVTFSGSQEVVIAQGEEAVSDPVKLVFTYGQDVAVSWHVVGETGPMTWHQVSFGTNYISPYDSGDKAAEISGSSLSQRSLGWFFLSGLDVMAPKERGTIVAIGDSITDGTMMDLGSNTRWTDLLAARLQEAGTPTGIVNEGINGNTVLHSGNAGTGPGAVDRFERDVLGRPNVKAVIIFEGTNDLGGNGTANQVYEGIRSMIDRAHERGICVVLATITPRAPYTWNNVNEREQQRQALNKKIRETSDVRGFIDFDKAIGMGNPTAPNPAFFFVDGIHPTTAGFHAMANAIPLDLFDPGVTCGAPRPSGAPRPN